MWVWVLVALCLWLLPGILAFSMTIVSMLRYTNIPFVGLLMEAHILFLYLIVCLALGPWFIKFHFMDPIFSDKNSDRVARHGKDK